MCVKVSGGDPGYGDTAKMLAEVGIQLALPANSAKLSAQAFGRGFLTPATAFGLSLAQRLHETVS